MSVSNGQRTSFGAVFFTVVAAGLHVIFGVWNVFCSGINADEGFYGLAARSVWEGDLPYRDFGYTQMPLLPYINGAVMKLTGFGLFEQRLVNGVWGALTLVLAVSWLARRTSLAWAVGSGLILTLSGTWMSYIHMGKTYAFTGLVMVLAFRVHFDHPASPRKLSLLALLGTLGVGCRLPSAPFFAVLWLTAAAELPRRPSRPLLRGLAQSLLWPALFVLPFYLAAPKAAWFWTLDFHRFSVPNKPWSLSWTVILALAPAVWLGIALAYGRAAVAGRLLDRRLLAALAATLLGSAANLLPAGVYEEYAVPFLPLLVLLTAQGLWDWGASRPWLRRAAIPVGLAVANAAASVALLWPTMQESRRHTVSVVLSLNGQDYDPALPGKFARACATVQQYLPPGRPFVGPELVLALATARPVPRNLRMAAFTATADLDAASAHRLNLITFAELERYFNDPGTPLLAFSKIGNLNYAWSMPSFRNPPERDRHRWIALFRRDFAVAYEDDIFLLLVRRQRSHEGN